MIDIQIAEPRHQIYTLPGRPPFMLSIDLAAIYGTTTQRINEQVRRNKAKFPADFCFQLTPDELVQLRRLMGAKCVLQLDMTRAGAYAFTHNGANQLATVLRTPVAVERSIMIARAFTAIEQQVTQRAQPTFDHPSGPMAALPIFAAPCCAPPGVGRPFEEAEPTRIYELALQGHGPTCIARRIGRPESSIGHLLRRIKRQAQPCGCHPGGESCR